MNSFSQLGQDLWVLNKLNHKQNGFFIEIGAHNGIDLSNTYLMETEYSWKGICVECNKNIVQELKKNRNCHVCDKAIFTHDNLSVYFDLQNEPMLSYLTNIPTDYLVETISVNTLLEKYNAPNVIDYISLDIEGLEFDILQSFDFNKYKVLTWTVEHNLVNTQESINNFFNILYLLLSKNYSVKLNKWDIFAFLDE